MANRADKEIKQYWVYRNITTFAASVIFAYFLFQTALVRDFMERLGSYGFVGAFFVGIFFPSSFTVAPATAGLILLARDLNFLGVSFAAGLGAAIGDFFIFRFIRDGLAADLSRLFAGVRNSRAWSLFHTKYFGLLTPFIGAFIIASPLPDELGIGMLGLSRISGKKFALFSFVLNFIGLAVLLGGIKFWLYV